MLETSENMYYNITLGHVFENHRTIHTFPKLDQPFTILRTPFQSFNGTEQFYTFQIQKWRLNSFNLFCWSFSFTVGLDPFRAKEKWQWRIMKKVTVNILPQLSNRVFPKFYFTVSSVVALMMNFIFDIIIVLYYLMLIYQFLSTKSM